MTDPDARVISIGKTLQQSYAPSVTLGATPCYVVTVARNHKVTDFAFTV